MNRVFRPSPPPPLPLVRAAVIGMALAVPTAAQEPPRLAQFEATYSVEYEGKDSGEAEFSLRYDEDSKTYTYTSRTRLKGLLVRALIPRPVVDRSVLRFDGEAIVPLRFEHEDGTRKGEENQSVVFDWQNMTAELTSEQGVRQTAIVAGTLDRASAQIALMHELRAGRRPSGVTAADGESIETYEYTWSGPVTVETAIGDERVIVATQQREGSSRRNVLRLATERDYLPVSIEQYRGEELRFAWRIEEIGP